ncbi:polyhydroxyalkanoic acid system protein [Pseudomonas sp. FFUP_PS_473]|jgi:putative polyhydroxyalkanoate system protein|uniref:polyhydroxyalkanoic acid system family protein n=1 Tax=Pseudomonas TaxID=286 RepID=UPI0008117E8B|nr:MULTISPECIES: polyhydroxyalkanoic acid system family protein [Pseudomonas]MBP9961403.1 polyhydroxyalkanoic acid system family protein [Pseudomonas sp.]MEE3633447.1 polyhydroxyalkanoic acid system family protein [Pseudomonas sp. AL 58]ATR81418.1 polyhydroxyalkanoic acid system protein [Pseudomonas sp. HLS-6]PLP91942.1 polyhydroxyalkanoic acid system protein [Pseudomonas sp. FFUP_PS_473]WJM97903.1 polyhydroxyalkanoic acid system family protein [Pseudomonas defluvii]
MTQISVERRHSLGREAARQKAEALVERLAREYDLKAQWEGDTVQVKRSGANGSIQIGDDSIRVELKLGMMLSMMGGTIKAEIERALDKALA